MLLERKTIELTKGVLMHIDPSSEFVALEVDGQKDRLVRKVDLWGACFLMADGKTQDQLMPIRQTEMTTVVRLHQVRVGKDLKKGEILSVRCETSLPTAVEEGLAGTLMKKRERGKKLLLPKVV